jgi:hypothetical protein
VAASVAAAAALPVHTLPLSAFLVPAYLLPPYGHFDISMLFCLQVALVGCNYSLADARRTLRQAGCEEVELESYTPTQSPKPISLPPVNRAHQGSAAAQRRILPPVPAPAPSATVLTAAAGPLSLSQATHQRNQAIFEVRTEVLWLVYARACLLSESLPP